MKKQMAAWGAMLKQEFRKDIELFEHFLLLLNQASPIRNVELVWAVDLEMLDLGLRTRLNTGDVLVQLQPAEADAPIHTSPSPSTHFCDLVHGFGAHEEQTCARSDGPAKERCRTSGCSQVYSCHVGLTDIAVPVICEGRYLGTLFSGQVLEAAPSPEGFAKVKAALEGQAHIDWAQLEEAYFSVPVVTRAQLAEMVRILEVFARYLANSWKRLQIMSEFERVRERELALDRRELAEMLLAGQVGSGLEADHEVLRVLALRLGLERLPDQVMVLRLKKAAALAAAERGAEHATATTIANQMTLFRAAHLIEDRCLGWPNTLATMVTPGEICIFTAQTAGTPRHAHLLLNEITQALLHIARTQGLTLARVGISDVHPQSTELLRAYHEACSALDSGHSAVNWFNALLDHQQPPVQALERVIKALQAEQPEAVTTAVREFLVAAAPAAATVTQLQEARGLLTWACEHLAREIAALGAGAVPVDLAKERAIQAIVGAPSFFAIREVFRNFVDQMRQEVLQLFSQREDKIVFEMQRLVRELGPAKVTIQDLAQGLKLSAGHLGRVYSRVTGHTLEEYLIRQRVEMGKRLLLDPRLRVAEVADLCGFCNPAYFASVFKKYIHCTPRAYASQPQRWGALESGRSPAPEKRDA